MEKKSISRQEFIGGALAIGTVALFGSTVATNTAMADDATTSDSQKQYGFWVNTKNCEDCGECAHACRRHNNTPEDVACRRKVVECKNSTGKTVYISVSCMHCSTPTCMEVCPAGAIYKRSEDGIVAVDKNRCIGCKYCYQACPFGVPHYTNEGMDKCDCCLGNGAYPENDPWCVQACPHDALHFGEIQSLLAQAGTAGKQFSAKTGPSLVLS